jgi:hypothetical protein
MQQRQPRLGDILDDYCPRERRLTNHAVVAMVGDVVKQTRCTTCEAEHEYKGGKVPRQRRKPDAPAALYAQVLAGGPKRVVPDPEAAPENDTASPTGEPAADDVLAAAEGSTPLAPDAEAEGDAGIDAEAESRDDTAEGGPVHRRLIRATLPRVEGQPPPTRPAPEFTIRQPTGGRGRFRPRHQGGGVPQGNRSNGNFDGRQSRGGPPRFGGGRPQQGAAHSHAGRRHGHKRSK